MELLTLYTNEINQNGYHLNKLTRNKIGFIYTAPIKIVPDDCLACDGYVLKIEDYKKLYSVIGSTFNNGEEAEDEFRIPDYNVTKRFLQPSNEVARKIAAGLPDIEGGYRHHGWGGDSYYGACYDNFQSFNYYGTGNQALSYKNGFKFKASASNSIYGNSTTVQPPAQTVHLCIKYK